MFRSLQNLPALAHRIMTKQPKPLPSHHQYSTNLKLLSTSLLNKKPELRPSVVAILRSDYLQRHISSLLSHTIKAGTGGMENDATEDNRGAPPPMVRAKANGGRYARIPHTHTHTHTQSTTVLTRR